MEWRHANNMKYPNITGCFSAHIRDDKSKFISFLSVCNPKFFDTRRMATYNISNMLANYISLSVDPTFNFFYRSMSCKLNLNNL